MVQPTHTDPHFDPEAHNKHEHMHLNDEMYIKHMIPHHQVAVDMSKNYQNTNNDFMIFLAYRIIHSQEEIALLNLHHKKNKGV